MEHLVQNGLEAPPQLRQGVFHPGRHLPVDLPVQKPVPLQLPELLGQGRLGDAVQAAQELAGALERAGERELLEAVEEPNFERLAEIKSRELQLQTELDGLSAQGEPQLTMDNLARVIELWTKIPASKIREEEFKRLSELDQRLRTKIVGQDEAIEAVSAAIRRGRVGLKEPDRPTGSFLLLGPSGVGKTELCRALAEAMFGQEEALIRIDMSEYAESHAASRLVGSPPGYVGHEEGGQLTEKIRKRPYAVVLFDEIEKAHPEVWNLLLQILEDGRLTDSHGRRADFRNAVVVMTSNVGARQITGGRALGFAGEADGEASRQERVRRSVTDELKRTFRPEFLNRIDDTVIFRQLDERDLREIARRMLEETARRMKPLGLALRAEEAAVDRLAEMCYDPVNGARPLRRALRRRVEDVIAEGVLSGRFRGGQGVILTVRENELAIMGEKE